MNIFIDLEKDKDKKKHKKKKKNEKGLDQLLYEKGIGEHNYRDSVVNYSLDSSKIKEE